MKLMPLVSIGTSWPSAIDSIGERHARDGVLGSELDTRVFGAAVGIAVIIAACYGTGHELLVQSDRRGAP